MNPRFPAQEAEWMGTLLPKSESRSDVVVGWKTQMFILGHAEFEVSAALTSIDITWQRNIKSAP